MTRNKPPPDVGSKLSKKVEDCTGGVMFTVDKNGNIQPDGTKEVKEVKVGETILTRADPSPGFSGSVCVKPEGGSCQCSRVVGVADGSHMDIETTYTISSKAVAEEELEIYAVVNAAQDPNTTNGKIRVGG
jgi:hypothetical protein